MTYVHLKKKKRTDDVIRIGFEKLRFIEGNNILDMILIQHALQHKKTPL